MTQLAACHRGSQALDTINSELIVEFKHRVVLLLLRHHTTLRQQLLDDITHALLPPASLHPTIRSFYHHIKQGRSSSAMTAYIQQHTDVTQHTADTMQQQWSTYSTLLLRTPTFTTLCDELKQLHATVLPELLAMPKPAADVDVSAEVEVSLDSVWVNETGLYEWLRWYRLHEDDGAVSDAVVRAEWQGIRAGTDETVVAWMAQRAKQSEQRRSQAAVSVGGMRSSDFIIHAC